MHVSRHKDSAALGHAAMLSSHCEGPEQLDTCGQSWFLLSLRRLDNVATRSEPSFGR